tara:strand:- start:73 stop:630 length:558 start_codon:yes stop_codon:yes gene_type:complete
MCQDEIKRIIIKQGAGVPTIPVSSDHRNGDWLATDVYVGEFYQDTNTGILYNRDATGIRVEGTGATYLEVDVSSAEALAIFTTAKPILSAPGAGLYYKYTAVLEQTFVTTAYTVSGGGDWYLNQGSKDYYFAKAAISHTSDAASQGTYYGFATPNTALTLTADSNPTLGDGTFKLKIWYTIETFR